MEFTGKHLAYFNKTGRTTSVCTICGETLPITNFYVSSKLYLDSKCINCNKEYHKEWRKTHRDTDRRLSREYWRANKEKALRSSRKRKYNLTDEQLDNLPQSCEICGSTKRLCVDHNHITGKYRGVLCSYCNSMLGHWNDKPEIFVKAIKYLNRDDSFVSL